jgi:hypothetical protein
LTPEGRLRLEPRRGNAHGEQPWASFLGLGRRLSCSAGDELRVLRQANCDYMQNRLAYFDLFSTMSHYPNQPELGALTSVAARLLTHGRISSRLRAGSSSRHNCHARVAAFQPFGSGRIERSVTI